MKIVSQYSHEELKTIAKSFEQSLSKSSSGIKTSLAFLKTSVSHTSFVKDEEQFQVMSFGGSVFEKALFRKNAQENILLEYERLALPPLLTKQILCEFFLQHLAENVRIIGVNFAYAIEPKIRSNMPDGKLLLAAKDHLFEGLIDQMVGETLENYEFEKKGRKIYVGLANDTTCLILSKKGSDCECIIGGVVGTGFNFGFFEDCETIINLESGAFSDFPQTKTGLAIDRESTNPGCDPFEKEVSGAYLYRHFNQIADENGFSRIRSTEDLGILAEGSGQEATIAQELFKRSASLVAAQITGIWNYKKQMSLNVVMEGSFFWKAPKYKDYLQEFLIILGIPDSIIRFERIERSALYGAAHLVSQSLYLK